MAAVCEAGECPWFLLLLAGRQEEGTMSTSLSTRCDKALPKGCRAESGAPEEEPDGMPEVDLETPEEEPDVEPGSGKTEGPEE